MTTDKLIEILRLYAGHPVIVELVCECLSLKEQLEEAQWNK